MPLQRIDLVQGRSEEQCRAIGDAVQRALVECIGVPLVEVARDDWSFGNGLAQYVPADSSA